MKAKVMFETEGNKKQEMLPAGRTYYSIGRFPGSISDKKIYQ